ncbi:glycosyl hydrolase catalytic core-domain-containing protein [Apodospora peruviana]|uniref:Glycosyl hydrolase catalytic core-domain-containing protein n=1 Tax=Apodospora peruviana TaxID=516989 RepID=A0AAE0LYZ6_9PEZI|nr:glycosyl hydrolase catalytic core-domain-containing protein [Apodospora peruviana]
MFSQIPLGAVVLGAALPFALAGPLASSKRGLCFVPNTTTPEDDTIWVQKPTDLTWYYNYDPTPSDVFAKVSQEEFEFVPMLWGVPPTPGDTAFLDTVKGLIKDGRNITHIMSFNEPDGPAEYGGANADPSAAAQAWVDNIIPLRKMGVKVGLPACTGSPDGLAWLKTFLDSCSTIVSDGGNKKNCSYDFVPIHWYGDFGGLASHMGEYSATFPNKSIWITEYNFNDQALSTTQDFYNMSAEYFDRLDFVERYSLFGAFRSDVSNVGANAAMLNKDGELTDIGAWYLGRPGTGVDPQSGKGVNGDSKSAGLRAVGVPQIGGVLLGAGFAVGVMMGL